MRQLELLLHTGQIVTSLVGDFIYFEARADLIDNGGLEIPIAHPVVLYRVSLFDA